jgi:hypothetical protein
VKHISITMAATRAPWLGACFVLVAAYAIYEKSLWTSPGGQPVGIDACSKNWIACIVMMPYWFWAAIACVGVRISTRPSHFGGVPEAAPVATAPAVAAQVPPVKTETQHFVPPTAAPTPLDWMRTMTPSTNNISISNTTGGLNIGQYNSTQPLGREVPLPGIKNMWENAAQT